MTQRGEAMAHTIMKPLSRVTSWLYRISGGRIGGRWITGEPVMLLTTIGRKSGIRRTVPVLYLRDGEDVVVVASGVGGARQPVWYLNLETNPEAEIEIGKSKMKMTARRATEEECTALWPKLIEMYRGFEGYRSRTEREIPLVILSPAAGRASSGASSPWRFGSA